MQTEAETSIIDKTTILFVHINHQKVLDNCQVLRSEASNIYIEMLKTIFEEPNINTWNFSFPITLKQATAITKFLPRLNITHLDVNCDTINDEMVSMFAKKLPKTLTHCSFSRTNETEQEKGLTKEGKTNLLKSIKARPNIISCQIDTEKQEDPDIKNLCDGHRAKANELIEKINDERTKLSEKEQAEIATKLPSIIAVLEENLGSKDGYRNASMRNIYFEEFLRKVFEKGVPLNNEAHKKTIPTLQHCKEADGLLIYTA
jgi:hypothetical protein